MLTISRLQQPAGKDFRLMWPRVQVSAGSITSKPT